LVKSLPFKTSDDALDYVERNFDKRPIKKGVSLIGVVRETSKIDGTQSFLVEVNASFGVFRKRTKRELVVGQIHPELEHEIQVGDLVNWGCLTHNSKLPAGFILHKLVPELDLSTGLFNEFVPTITDLMNGMSDEELSKALKGATDTWKYQVDGTYGKILRRSEILEDHENYYFYYKQNDLRQRVVAWNKSNKQWSLGYSRDQLDGLNFTSNRLFEDVVFPSSQEDQSYQRKQTLSDFLLFSISETGSKALAATMENGSKVSFELPASEWNNALLGNTVLSRRDATLITSDGASQQVQCQFCFQELWLNIIVMHSDPEQAVTIGIKNLDGYFSEER